MILLLKNKTSLHQQVTLAELLEHFITAKPLLCQEKFRRPLSFPTKPPKTPNLPIQKDLQAFRNPKTLLSLAKYLIARGKNSLQKILLKLHPKSRLGSPSN
jgi:hypothetical protein